MRRFFFIVFLFRYIIFYFIFIICLFVFFCCFRISFIFSFAAFLFAIFLLRIEPSLGYVPRHLLYIELIRVVQVTCNQHLTLE